MGNGRLKNSVRNMYIGLFSKFVSILFPFIIRTLIIKMIGVEYMGLNGLFTSVLSVLSISELGFSSAMVYSMYRPLAENDTPKINALLNLYKQIYRFIGLFILIAGLGLLPFLDFFVHGDCPSDINLHTLYLIFLINAAVSYFMFAYKSSIITVYQREDINSNIMTAVNMCMYIAQIIVLIVLKNYMAYIVLMPIATITMNIIRSIIVDKIYPQYKCEGKISRGELKEICKNVAALVGNKINGTIILSSDNIVISSVLGLSAVAIYNNYYCIINALIGFMTIFYNSVRASIGNSLVTESKEKNYRDLKKISVLIAWIVGWSSICMVCLFQPFMLIWIGKEYLMPFLTVFILAIYFYEWKLLDVLILYRDAAGMWWSDKFRPYVISILNLLGNITLVSIWGLNGIVFSTFFTSCCISYPWVLYVLFKEYFGKDMKKYIGFMARITMILFVIGLLTYCAVNILPSEGIVYFILKCVICVLLPNCLLLLTLGKMNEMKENIKQIMQLLKPKGK